MTNPGKPTSPEEETSRRKFLFLTGSATVIAGVLGFLGATVRYLFPNVLYEPPNRFPIGFAKDFPPGSVTFLATHQVFIFTTTQGFYAISSICTHLGCNVRYVTGDGFACPCHGSLYDKNGNVVAGPAPRPLPWFGMSLSSRGELVVDKGRLEKPDYRFKV